jgi:hypothetical protein
LLPCLVSRIVPKLAELLIALFFCLQRHSRGTAATAFAMVAAAGPHSCTVLLRPAARRRTSGLMTFEDPLPHAIRMSPSCFGFLIQSRHVQPIKSGHVPATSEFPAPSEFPFIALSAQIPTPPLALV